MVVRCMPKFLECNLRLFTIFSASSQMWLLNWLADTILLGEKDGHWQKNLLMPSIAELFLAPEIPTQGWIGVLGSADQWPLPHIYPDTSVLLKMQYLIQHATSLNKTVAFKIFVWTACKVMDDEVQGQACIIKQIFAKNLGYKFQGHWQCYEVRRKLVI